MIAFETSGSSSLGEFGASDLQRLEEDSIKPSIEELVEMAGRLASKTTSVPH